MPNMDFELHPTVKPLEEQSFNVLVAPREHFIAMLNRNLKPPQRYKVLFVTGNHSGMLSRPHSRFAELEIRRRGSSVKIKDGEGINGAESLASHQAPPLRLLPFPPWLAFWSVVNEG
ncbi:MAG: hypothetical protein LUQ22_01645 [Methanotrichaceae archaeon]|nr:hypothetical protein [Methanotrichaceae archaeon]